jgi:hypothetical protein
VVPPYPSFPRAPDFRPGVTWPSLAALVEKATGCLLVDVLAALLAYAHALPPSRRLPIRVGCAQLGQISMTLETWIVPSIVMMPPCWFLVDGRVAFLIMDTPSTVTRSLYGYARRTLPSLPLSLPAMTWTLSPLRIVSDFAISSAS